MCTMIGMRPTLQPLQPTHAASPPAPGSPTVIRGRLIFVAALVLATAAFATLASAPSSPAATLADKQAQAARLDEQVRKIERRYDELQERWRGAQIELDALEADVADAHAQVLSTRRGLKRAKVRLAVRAGQIYRAGGSGGDLAELATAGSVSGFFDRMETIRRVGDQDASVLVRVERLNTAVEQEERVLRTAKARAATSERTARAAKREMGTLLDARQAKLNSVTADIQAIMAEQRRLQAARAAAAARESAALASPTDGASDSSSSGGSSGGSSIPLPPGSGSAAGAASAAMSKLGSPYVWAAAGPDTFDCSGLVMWAFAQVGRSMPHSTYVYAGMGVDVPLDQLQVGDLVFGSGDGHMGIYVGGNSFVHAPRSGDVVKVTSMNDYAVTHARRV